MSKDGVVRCEGIPLGPERDTMSRRGRADPTRASQVGCPRAFENRRQLYSLFAWLNWWLIYVREKHRCEQAGSPERRRKQKYSARTLAHVETREQRTEPNLGQKLVRMR
jgi:hypothetical protein